MCYRLGLLLHIFAYAFLNIDKMDLLHTFVIKKFLNGFDTRNEERYTDNSIYRHCLNFLAFFRVNNLKIGIFVYYSLKMESGLLCETLHGALSKIKSYLY